MKISIAIAGLSALLCFALPALGEEDYWARIAAYIEEGKRATTPEERRMLEEAAEKYVRSLRPEQLIIAGRQCSREEERVVSPDHWDEVGRALVFFFHYYPSTPEGRRDIAPLLREIEDKKQSPFWRRHLVNFLLGEWGNIDETMSVDQRLDVFECLQKVLFDKTDSIHVRDAIPQQLAWMLATLYENLRAASQQGEGEKQVQAKEELKRFSERLGAYVKNNLEMLSDPKTPPTLLQRLVSGVTFLEKEGVPGADGVRAAVAKAFGSYQDYPESVWQQLAYAAVWQFHLPNAKAIIERMIADVRNDSLGEDRAESLRGILRSIQRDIDVAERSGD